MAGRRPTPEKLFQDEVVKMMRARGYVVEHTYALRTDDGSWRTGSTLKGKPDLMAYRPPRFAAVEIKGADGRLRPEQQAVLSWFAGIPNARCWVLSPADDLDLVGGWLDDLRAAPRVHGFTRLSELDAYRVVAPASARKAR